MNENFHIGLMIKEECRRQHMSVATLAEKICCARANVYNIFKRRNIDIALLALISKVLHRNFVLECAKAVDVA